MEKVKKVLVDQLVEFGVDNVYGYPGDTILEL